MMLDSNYSVVLKKIYLDGDISFSDLPHVESNCRDHVFTEISRLKGEKWVHFRQVLIKFSFVFAGHIRM